MNAPSAKSPFWKSLSFRLNLWYSTIFTVSMLAILGLLYALMTLTIERKDREVVQARAKELATVYYAGGIPALERYLRTAEGAAQPYFVRVILPNGAIRLVAVPNDWVQEKIEEVDIFGRRRLSPYYRVPKNAEKDFTLSTLELSGGSVLQVGRSAGSREILLRPFRTLILGVMAPIVLIGFIGGAVFAHHAMLPVRQVVAAARKIIQTGKLDARVPTRDRDDELDELAILPKAPS